MHQSIAGYHTNNRNNSLRSPAPRNSAVITIPIASGRPDRTQEIERDNYNAALNSLHHNDKIVQHDVSAESHATAFTTSTLASIAPWPGSVGALAPWSRRGGGVIGNW